MTIRDDMHGWNGLLETVRAQALPRQGKLRDSGWQFGKIRWLGLYRLRFMVKKPNGKVMPVVCDENALTMTLEQLQSLP